MLSKNEKLSRLDFQKLKGLKFQKTPTNIGVFCIYKSFPHLKTNLQPIFFKANIVVSKKNFKTAVSRNKAKRIYYNYIIGLKKENPEFFHKILNEKVLVFYPNKIFTKEELSKIFLNLQ
jgi:RNase P protein component